MTLNQLILEKLNANFPGHTFTLLPEMDFVANGSSVRVTLNIDGKRSSYGYYPNVIRDLNLTDDTYSDQFVFNVRALGLAK
jgi:hypothetical protein